MTLSLSLILDLINNIRATASTPRGEPTERERERVAGIDTDLHYSWKVLTVSFPALAINSSCQTRPFRFSSRFSLSRPPSTDLRASRLKGHRQKEHGWEATYLAWEITSAPALASNSSDCNSVTAVKDIKDSLMYRRHHELEQNYSLFLSLSLRCVCVHVSSSLFIHL